MVVMAVVEGENAYDKFRGRRLPPGVRANIEKAKTVLHEAGLVFGDLRRPNIMVTPGDRAMLIDFDWAGKAGEATYPFHLNVSGEIHWADGVGPGTIMESEHDNVMFARLDEQ